MNDRTSSARDERSVSGSSITPANGSSATTGRAPAGRRAATRGTDGRAEAATDRDLAQPLLRGGIDVRGRDPAERPVLVRTSTVHQFGEIRNGEAREALEDPA
jgi:hypothetical protein